MKISGKRLTLYAEKEYGDTLNSLKNCKIKSIKQKVKKQLNTKIRNNLKKILNQEL